MSSEVRPQLAPAALPGEDLLREIERAAVDLAALGGAAIEAALGRTLAVRYKSDEGDELSLRDPVSEVDHEVELLIRRRLADRFPGHDILGEESEERPGRDHDFVWAVDPVDGTTNFVNGFPIFASSIGVLYRGVPVVGAVWVGATHALRPGVYHARAGGVLRFNSERLDFRANPQVRRYLAGEPYASRGAPVPWEVRKTGSAAAECAYVAAGLMRVARFERPNVWDVAGGIALVLATGGSVSQCIDGHWQEFRAFEKFDGATGAPDLRHWRAPLVMGEASAVATMCRTIDASRENPPG